MVWVSSLVFFPDKLSNVYNLPRIKQEEHELSNMVDLAFIQKTPNYDTFVPIMLNCFIVLLPAVWYRAQILKCREIKVFHLTFY